MSGGRAQEYNESRGFKYVTYCEVYERIVPWAGRRGFCIMKEIAKKGAPPTPVFCEHFCECWEHLDNMPEVLCECFGIEKFCEEVRGDGEN